MKYISRDNLSFVVYFELIIPVQPQTRADRS